MENKILLSEIANELGTEKFNDSYLLNFIVCLTYKKISKIQSPNLIETANSMLRSYTDKQIEFGKKKLDALSNEELKDFLKYTLREYDTPYSPVVVSTRSLSELAYKLLELNGGGEIVLDLGSGYGNFFIDILDNHKKRNYHFKDLFGVEIGREPATISNMALECLDDDGHFFIDNRDIVDLKDHYFRCCSHAYTFPPLNIQMKNISMSYVSEMFDYKFSPRMNAQWVFVDQLLHRTMKPNFRGVAILPSRTLFNSTDQGYRDLLLKNGYIEGIIKLPDNALNNIGLSLVALVLSSNNKNVKILDATHFVTKNIGTKGNVMNFEKIASEYYSAKALRKNNDELIGASNLLPSALMGAKNQYVYPKSVKMVKLTDVAEVLVGSQYTTKHFEHDIVNEKTGFRILTSSDINNGNVNWDELISINNTDAKAVKNKLEKNDIVLTSKSSIYKTAVVDVDLKDTIIVTGGMFIIRPNPKKINPTYLKSYFDSDAGRCDVRRIQKGAYIMTINRVDLANLLIPVVSLPKQEAMARKYNRYLSTLLAYKEEIKRVENKLDSFFVEEMED